MSKKKILRPFFIILLIIGLVVASFASGFCYANRDEKEEAHVTKAMMILIEFQQTEGLVNMAAQMEERGVTGLLMVTPDFVEKNATEINQVLSLGNIEIVASYVEKPFWDIPYGEQYSIIEDMVSRIEKVTQEDVRFISSRYMASDENTIKAADALGIEYVTARGTTQLAATVYKADEYDVKILSVSNIDIPEFEYGSLCDYSFYERGGSPEDILETLERAIENDKFIGVSHTYIGGYKKRWNDMWLEFWDKNEIDWVDADELMEVDKNMPMWQIPINKNAPYTPEKIRPIIPYDEEQNVINPCSID